MTHRHGQFWPQLILLALFLALACLGCNSKAGGLPRIAKSTLDKRVAELTGSEIDYRVISSQKAIDRSEANLEQALSHRQRRPGMCPEDESRPEIWCVVVDQEITDEEGQGYSRFLVKRVGTTWSAEELTDDESDLFNYCGCRNWEVGEQEE